jgi:N-acetylglucosamine kinase
MSTYLSVVSDVLSLVVNVIGPGIVPVGGGLSKSPELVAALDREVRRRILRRTDRPLVVPAQLTVEPGLVGAAILGGLV